MQDHLYLNGRKTADALQSSRPALVILGCSQRKKQTSRLIPAIERYDGPAFRVLRKYIQLEQTKAIHSSILSARFGLVSGSFLTPRYNRTMDFCSSGLQRQVEEQLKGMLDDVQPKRLFVSVGREYWPLLESSLIREVPTELLFIASGGIGGRTSQLANWLSEASQEPGASVCAVPEGEATLLGATVRLSRNQVLELASRSLLKAPREARRFETWFVEVGSERVAPKWLVSLLFQRPVAKFRTADAKRVLLKLGIEIKYAD